MIIELNGIQGVEVNPTTIVGRGFINVNLIGVEKEHLLKHIDIKDIIEYFGETDILDHIGKDVIQDHMDSKSEEEN